MLTERNGANLLPQSLKARAEKFKASIREGYHSAKKLKESSQLITGRQVIDYFRDLEKNSGREPKSWIIQLISQHRYYEQRILERNEWDTIQWFFDPTNPSHISYHLTEGGTDRRLPYVAVRYLHGAFRARGTDPWQEDTVLDMLDELNKGKKLPQVILTTRYNRQAPDGNIHIYDGVHRLLAGAIYLQQTGTIPPIQAYIA